MKKVMGELALIESIRFGGGAGQRGHGVRLGIGDDCAILRQPKGHEILVTTDFTLEGRHFRRDLHPPESVGHRALARGLSDLGAMGARPLAAFLSLALPSEMLTTSGGRRWVERFLSGLRGLAQEFSVPLAGGDTSESPTNLVLADIVLVGSAPAGRALRRSGGRAGDALYVTGELGGAAAELAAMKRRPGKRQHILSDKTGKDGPPGFVGRPQMYPRPRVEVGLALLRRHLATAAISTADLPIHSLALAAGSMLAVDFALNGGEDYELLFAASPGVHMPRSIAGVRITRIGSLVRGSAVTMMDSAGRGTPLKPGGWEHFAGKH